MARFNDRLTVPEIAAGADATIANMDGLVTAARALTAASSFGPAFALSVMTLEEAGKLHVLRAMCQRGGIPETKWRQLWASFRSHQYKSSSGLMDCYPDDIRGDQEAILELALNHQATAGRVEEDRQWSLYVDFDPATRTWNRPSEFDRQRADETLAQAEVAVQRAKNHQGAGLFSVGALSLMRELYEPFFRGLLTRDEPVSAGEVAQLVLPVHREYFRRLLEEGILDPLSGVELLL
jgi:AbiV family abortive infection protein